MNIEELRAEFSYEPITGRLKRKYNGREITGPYRLGKQRYATAHFQGKLLYAARIIWALHTGEWPPSHLVIDHENGNTHDNRICNLRLITRGENKANNKRTQALNGLLQLIRGV